MPVTLRYEDTVDSGQPLAAVFATKEDAEAQAEHDVLVLGRRIKDIVEGEVTYDGTPVARDNKGRVTVSPKDKEPKSLRLDFKSLHSRNRPSQWPPAKGDE